MGYTTIELALKKEQAKKLVLSSKYTLTEISKRLKISAGTLASWRDRYGWGAENEEELYVDKPSHNLKNFMLHLSEVNPELYGNVIHYYKTFIEKLQRHGAK